jgi:RHS repeat-associated protein
MTDGTGTTSYSYDALNRLTSQTNGAGQSVAYGYDLKGDPTSITYPNGKTVSRSYDAAGRLTRITDWLGHSTTFTPDADSNTAGVAYPNGITASSVFDAADQVTKITHVNAGGATVAGFTYTRDGNSQLTGTTPTGTGQGGNETYSYTKLNQLATLNGSTYANDAADNLTKLASGATLAYDAANELTGMSSGGQTATFLNDSSGNRTRGGAPGGPPVDYVYDQANRLVSTGGTGRLFAYAAGTACNAITVSHGSDDFSHGVLWSNGGITASGASNSALAVLVAKKPPTCSFPSQFTPPGPTAVAPRAAGDWPVPLPTPPSTCTSGDAPKINATWLTTHAPGVYCWTGTITIAAPGATFNGYEFVSNGSTQTGAITVLESAAFVGSAANANVGLYATAGGVTVNKAVTLSAQILAPRGTVVFNGAGNNVKSGFVEANALTINSGPSTFAGSGPDVLRTSYAYDGAGLRSATTTGATTQHFAWDVSGKLPVLLTDGSTSYIYGDNGLPIEQIDGSGTPLYYQQDELGSTRLLTDQGGGVVATFSYDPYGNLTGHTGGADTPLRWAGQYQDASTSFYYMRARYYDPQTAQFITRDPLARLTQAPYGYAGSNPLNLADLTGLDCGWNPFCYAGEAIGWAFDHPIEAIGITVATASLIVTLGADAPEVLAVDFALVETAEGGTAFAVVFEEVAVSESELSSLLGAILAANGAVEAARDCIYDRDVTRCAWDITTFLIARGLSKVGADELQRAVYEWLVEVGGPILLPEPSEPPSPPGGLGPPCLT